jgi:outer membrane receptor protein involved in Fe transport
MGGKVRLLFKYWLLCCLSLCLVPLTIGTSSSVQAQGDDAEEFTLEEIVVTAEKREAQLQKIPMDISVVNPDTMRLYNINQMHDLQKMIPDLSITNTVGSFNLITIREVQTNLFNPIYETTVATHLDGIQLNRFTGLDNFFFDLERVEVLKGPQGTLYGRGSTAGSMNIITRKPILGEFSGNASIETGNYGRYRADWAINFPLGDKSAMRIAGRRNISAGVSDSGFGDTNTWSHRISWRWEPNDRTTINLSTDYIWEFDNGQPMSGFSATGYYFDTYGGGVEIVAPPATATVYSALYQSGGPVHARGESKWALLNSADRNYIDNKHYGMAGSFAYDLDFATATLELGHRALTENKDFMWAGASLWPIFGSNTGSGYTQAYVYVMTPTLFEHAVTSGNTNSAEARLTSNTTIAGGDKLEWIAGLMAQRDMTRELMISEAFNSHFDVQIKTATEGAFTQASWMPIDKWNLTGGLRQNWDAKDYYGDYQSDDYFTADASWSELTYRLNLSYFPTADIMPYLSFSKGYRTGNLAYSGGPVPPELLNAWELGLKSRFLDNKLQVNAGFYLYDYKNYGSWVFVSKCWTDNNTFYDPNSYAMNFPGDHKCDDVSGNPADGYTPYDPDTGVTDPNGTVDSWDYEYNTYTSFSPGGADMKGLAVSIDYLPTMNDRVSVSASWRKNKYKSPYDPLAAILALYPDADSPYLSYSADPDIGGYEFGGAPIRGNASYTHTFRFGSGDTLMATGSYFYEGKGIDQYMNQTYDNEYPMPGRPAYWTGDVSLMYTSSRWMPAGNMWSLRFSAQNIFDNDALSSISYSNYWFSRGYAYSTGSGTVSGIYINPRTYSVTFDVNF